MPEHVVVCGAGLVGAAVADALSAHVATTLVEAEDIASGTTGATFAWINASSKSPEHYHAINAGGVAGHRQLAVELPSAGWLHPIGTLLWREASGDQVPAFVRDLEAWSYPHHQIDRDRLLATEPALAIGAEIHGVAVADEGWVDAPTLAKLLTVRAEQRGATVRLGASVVAADRDRAGRLAGLRLADGERIACDAVVNCAGAAAGALARALGVPPPPLQEGTEGLLVRLAVDQVPVSAVVWSPTVHVRPDGPGVLLTGDDAVDGLLRTAGERSAVDELCRRTAELLPATAGAEVLDVRVGTRPKPVDGLSSVGGLEAHPGYFEAVTHSGVTLAPVLARFLTTELVTGEVEPLATPFRPGRFSGRRSV